MVSVFTGIVVTTGRVRSILKGSHGARLLIDAPDLPRPIQDGASVAINGVCLTVVDSDDVTIQFDAVPETLERSTLGRLRIDQRVNLEPSLRVGDPMDGHLVQGHIDGIATVTDIARDAQGEIWTFAPLPELMPFLIPKGSVAVDGVSLTIARVSDETFSVALIPATLDVTCLGDLQRGEAVNIETDILVRTVVHTLRQQSLFKPSLTVDVLRENGW